jgi:hypothetical protein
MGFKQDIKAIKEILEGIHRRNKLYNEKETRKRKRKREKKREEKGEVKKVNELYKGVFGKQTPKGL